MMRCCKKLTIGFWTICRHLGHQIATIISFFSSTSSLWIWLFRQQWFYHIRMMRCHEKLTINWVLNKLPTPWSSNSHHHFLFFFSISSLWIWPFRQRWFHHFLFSSTSSPWIWLWRQWFYQIYQEHQDYMNLLSDGFSLTVLWLDIVQSFPL